MFYFLEMENYLVKVVSFEGCLSHERGMEVLEISKMIVGQM